MEGAAEQNGVVSLTQSAATEAEGHVCGLCGCPDHRACGCEANAAASSAAKTEPPALKIEPPAANIAEAVRAATKVGMSMDEKIEATDEALSQIIENRDAALATQRDIVEQLKIMNNRVDEFLNVISTVYQTRKPFPEY
jgi:hypothetical protein